jgi:hypothetical protein
MKFILKLLLFLCILIVGIYAATPLWLSYILANQLPPGWRLEELEAGYPGISGININVLSAKGGLQATDLEVSAADIRFRYRGLKTRIESLSLDVWLRSGESTVAETLTLDDLSLPVTRLTGKMPELSVGHVRLALHHDVDIMATNPLVLNFQSLKLTPQSDSNFHLVSDVGLEGSPYVNGRAEVDVTTNLLKAGVRFPDDSDSPPWLTISFEQDDQFQKATTRIQASFDAESAKLEWLDSILVQNTGGLLTHVSGKLEAQADFAGKSLQGIELFSLVIEELQLVSGDGILSLDAEMLARREAEKIIVGLPTTTEIQYQDKAGRLNDLITNAIPDLKRTPRSDTNIFAALGSGSSFTIQPGSSPSIGFNGDFMADLVSSGESLSMQATDLQLETADLSRLETTTVNGVIILNFVESMPFAYIFRKEDSPPMTVEAKEISITAEVTSGDDGLVSTGSGTIMGGHTTLFTTSAEKIDISWHELDLLKLAGKLGTKTTGFATEFEGESWSGFDFDMTYNLLSDTGISGSGTLEIDNGPGLPIEFAGNIQAEHWNVTLPASTIKLAELRNLLGVAHFELPASVKLTNGYIDLQGDVLVDDEITAEMVIKGYEMGGSMQESTARKASFTLNSSYGNTLTANGPVAIENVVLAGGIDVEQIRAQLNIENTETFGLKNLFAELFDGQLNLASLQFSDNRIEHTTAEFTHINLSRLLVYTGIYGLEGSGFLDVSLPVGSDEVGIYIKNGSFNSTGAGRLAYTKEGIAVDNIGLQALENFHYQEFSGTLDYQSDGAYKITIHLEGENPDLYGGHPILFNLNIGGSLPELFEAMFITGSFEESIINQIRTH